MEATVEELEHVISNLPQNQLKKIRAWYEKFDSDAWDQQIEKDVVEGRLDALAEAAITDHISGKATCAVKEK